PPPRDRIAAKLDRLLPLQHRPCALLELERTIGSVVDGNDAAGGELPEDGLPALLVEVLPDAESRQVVMPAAFDLLRLVTAQNIDEVTRTEALACPVDGGKGLACGFRSIPHLGGRKTGIAIA